MKNSRFTEQQLVTIIKEVEIGAKVNAICRKYGISDAIYYKWESAMLAWKFLNFASCEICKQRMRGSKRCIPIGL